MKKKAITAEELKALLLARFDAERVHAAKLRVRFQQALGGEAQEEGPEVVAVTKKIMDSVSGVVAHRLKSNRNSTPLLSPRDLIKVASMLVEDIERIDCCELEAEKRKTIEKFIHTMLNNIIDLADGMVLPGKDPYDEYWRWVSAVLGLAAERGVVPTELFVLEEATDEIKRRLFSKEEFLILSKNALNKFMDVDAVKKIFITPMLDMLAGDNEQMRDKIKRELEAEAMPRLREAVEKCAAITNAWINEEALRIYGNFLS
jgi:hypothetical protein